MALKKDCLKKLPGRLKATFFNTLHTLPITIACMTAATLTANALFHLSGNAINVSITFWRSCSMLSILSATALVSLPLFTVYSGSIMPTLTHI